MIPVLVPYCLRLTVTLPVPSCIIERLASPISHDHLGTTLDAKRGSTGMALPRMRMGLASLFQSPSTSRDRFDHVIDIPRETKPTTN